MDLLAKKQMYDESHDALVNAMTGLSDHLLDYADSRYKKAALERVEEAYLWATQMIHEKIRLEEEAIAKLNELKQMDQKVQDSIEENAPQENVA